MDKDQKQRVIDELTERLRATDTLIVADYRGLTMQQVDELRGKLLEHGAKFRVVKNTLTRRAAEAAGAEQLLALLEGPTAIAFIESEGDPVAVAKALSGAAKETQVLALRGGVLQGKVITSDEVESLATLPPLDLLRGQVLGAVTAPLTTIVGLFNAPLQNLIGLIDARIEQLQAAGDVSAAQAAEASAEADASADTMATATAVADQEETHEPDTTRTEEEGEDQNG